MTDEELKAIRERLPVFYMNDSPGATEMAEAVEDLLNWAERLQKDLNSAEEFIRELQDGADD
jgi:hypothetical protein